MSTKIIKVESILFLFVFCLFMALSVVCQLERKEQREEKKQESKIENEEKGELIKKPIIELTKEPIKRSVVRVDKVTKEPTEEPIVKKETTEKPIVENSELVSLGTFKLTAYCNCSSCCGQWAGGNTASGTMPTANRTIAVDTSVIPFGTEVVINGNTYVAEDTGSAINGNKIDIYMNSHQAALNFGVQYAEVFIYK